MSTTRALSSLLLPPGILILLLWAGIALLSRRRRMGRRLVVLAAVLLTAFSVPVVSEVLCRGIEVYPPLSHGDLVRGAQAIIVLAGGWTRTPEYGGWTVNDHSLERLRYGARLHRRTGLPLLLTGGTGDESGPTEAELMRDALEQDFGLQARWIDTHSQNTAENARYAAAILKRNGIREIFLVTHAFHLARAVPEFEAQGLKVIPAPTRFCASREWRFEASDFLPGHRALSRSYLALHEYVGRLWYAIRY